MKNFLYLCSLDIYNYITMKKAVLIFLVSLMTTTLFAFNADDVTMVSYEQEWSDTDGSIALKNNTNEDIHNVVFQIVYVDKADKDLDYKVFHKVVTIAPGMTKRISIPAFERGRYYYYESDGLESLSAFKVKYELKGYNTTLSDVDDELTNLDKDKYWTYPILAIIFVLFFIGVWIGLYVLVAVMAQKRHRSVAVWVLLSIIASPILIVIILLVIGNDENYIEDE